MSPQCEAKERRVFDAGSISTSGVEKEHEADEMPAFASPEGKGFYLLNQFQRLGEDYRYNPDYLRQLAARGVFGDEAIKIGKGFRGIWLLSLEGVADHVGGKKKRGGRPRGPYKG